MSETEILLNVEADERAAVLKEAASWLGTPWSHMARTKGLGVDCAQYVWAVFYNCGLTDYMNLEKYPIDFFLHRGVERYMSIVLGRAHEVAWPQPGDLVLFKIGRVFAHGGIVAERGYPFIYHAFREVGHVVMDRVDSGSLSSCDHKFFSRW